MTWNTDTEHFYTDKKTCRLIGGHAILLSFAQNISEELFRHNC